MPPKYVFLTEVSDFTEAQVVKALLEAMYLHPRLRDEQTRAIVPHMSQLLGKLVMEIPEDEFMKASQALEQMQDAHRPVAPVTQQVEAEMQLTFTQELAKKALLTAVIGCIFIPLICNLFSIILSFRVIRLERPLSRVSGKRLMWAIAFNAFGFYIWLTLGTKYFFHH
jgi:hypothetical protein